MFKKIILLVVFFFMANVFADTPLPEKQVNYQGPIFNIFFHPLIAYPNLAFDPKNDHLVYIDSWFVTTREFKKIMAEVYRRGFILVSPKDLFQEEKDTAGKIIFVRKKLLLPEGKKPLILSLDDYNFYHSMKQHGTIHRFWVDPHGQLLTVTNMPNGKITINNDQEVPQLLEDFIALHPDFSFHHARGIIALTGYNGIFGYDTHKLFANNYFSQRAEAKKVVNRLKRMGWEFASHSYFHLGMDKQNEQAFEASERRWLKEVGSIVGPTSYYIFPFGDAWNKVAIRMNFLKRLGYRYFFGVSKVSQTFFEPGAVIFERFPMDGRSLRQVYTGAEVFVDPLKVFDPERPLKLK